MENKTASAKSDIVARALAVLEQAQGVRRATDDHTQPPQGDADEKVRSTHSVKR